MQNTGFAWLGSRRARKWDVANKGRLLDQAASAGLPVPSGGILLDEFYQLLVREQVLEIIGDQVRVPDAQFLFEALYAGIRFPQLDGPAIVRTIPPDINPVSGGTAAKAAWMPVELQDAHQLADALSQAYSTAFVWSKESEAPGNRFRRDLILMKMVEASTSGSAAICLDKSFDEVAYDGQMEALPRLGLWRSPDAGLPPFAQRLQMLLRGVRRSVGKQGIRVDWIDDGDICWLVQLAPLQAQG